jgi:hypothetical protein
MLNIPVAEANHAFKITDISFDADGRTYGKYTKKYPDRENKPTHRRGDIFGVTVKLTHRPTTLSMAIKGPPKYSWDFDTIKCIFAKNPGVKPICDHGLKSKGLHIELKQWQGNMLKFDVTLEKGLSVVDVPIGQYKAIVEALILREDVKDPELIHDMDEFGLGVRVDKKDSIKNLKRGFNVIFNPFYIMDMDTYLHIDSYKSAFVYSNNKGHKARDEYGIWFSAREKDTGLIFEDWETMAEGRLYELKPFSDRIYKQTIEFLDGKARSKALDVYEDLSKYVSGRLKKDIYVAHYSVVNLQKPGTKAQCASFANLLVSHLRSVGIVSLPVCADSHEIHHGADRWKFHTWVEAWIRGNRLFVDPFVPYHKPKKGREFAIQDNIYSKDYNDLVCVGRPSWERGDIGKNKKAYMAGFKGNEDPIMWSLGYPTTSFNNTANHNLIADVSRNYWPGGADPPEERSLPESYIVSIVSDKESFHPGDTASFKVTATNNTDKSITLPLKIEARSSDPSVKASVYEILFRKESNISVGAKEEQSFAMDFYLPLTARSDLQYLMIISWGDAMNACSFRVVPWFAAKLHLSEEVIVDKASEILIEISNKANHSIDNINCEIVLPDTYLVDNPKIRQITSLKEGERRLFKWSYMPIEGGLDAIIVKITSDNGGHQNIERVSTVLSDIFVTIQAPVEAIVGKNFDVSAKVRNINKNIQLHDAKIELVAPDFTIISPVQTIGSFGSDSQRTIKWTISANKSGRHEIMVRLLDEKSDIERDDISLVAVRDPGFSIPIEAITEKGGVNIIFDCSPDKLNTKEALFRFKFLDPYTQIPLGNIFYVLILMSNGTELSSRKVQADPHGVSIVKVPLGFLNDGNAVLRLSDIAGTGERIEISLGGNPVSEGSNIGGIVVLLVFIGVIVTVTIGCYFFVTRRK